MTQVVVAELAQGSASALRACDGLSSPAEKGRQQLSTSQTPSSAPHPPGSFLTELMGLTGPAARSTSPPTCHLPLFPILSHHPGKEAADLELPKGTGRVTLRDPNRREWEKGFFIWRECKRMPRSGPHILLEGRDQGTSPTF